MGNKSAALAILIISLIFGGYLIYLGLGTTPTPSSSSKNSTTQTSTAPPITGKPETFTISLKPGSKLYLRNYYYAKPNEKPVSNTTFEVEITDIDWPFIIGTYKLVNQNKTGIARMAIANLAIPKEMLGKKNVNLPIIIPAIGSGFCANLTYAGSINLTLTNNTIKALKYIINTNITGFHLMATLYYEKDSGMLLKSNFTIILNKKNEIISVLELINVTGKGSIRATTPSSWICNPPISGDLRFQKEGTYIIQDMKATPVKPGKIREISLEKGIVLVIIKDGQEITNEFWQNILAASNKCPQAKIYAVIIGGLTDNVTRTVAKYILERSAASEQTVLVKFDNGKPVYKVYRYGDLAEITSLLCGSHSSRG